MKTLYEICRKDADEYCVPRVDSEDLRSFSGYSGTDIREGDFYIFKILKEEDEYILVPNVENIKSVIKRKHERLTDIISMPITKELSIQIKNTIDDPTKSWFYETSEDQAELISEDMFLFDLLDGESYKVIGVYNLYD